MYSSLLGIITIRGNNSYLFDIIEEMSITCEDIIFHDPQNHLEYTEWDTLTEYFGQDFPIHSDPLDPSIYDPDWIISLYSDEAPGRRFRYMKDSLCANEYVNYWTGTARYLWDSIDQYRADKLWGQFEYPFLWKYIPEIDYQWDNGILVPINQPGPVEKSSIPIDSYRFLTEQSRLTRYFEFFQEKEKYNQITQTHYKSLLDEKPALRMIQ
jgi:hypothetical protein